MALTKIVRSEKAPRTGEYASNPERKNTPCISDLAGVKFLLKKERVFFFRGSALQVFGQCVWLQCGLGFAKTIFWGKGFGKPSVVFFFCVLSARGRGLGRNPRGIPFGFSGRFSKIKKN